MYIWTIEQQILNLDNYKRVGVNFISGGKYRLAAHDTPKETVNLDYGISIATFDNEVDAMYARCLLFKALMDKAGAWDATAVPKLSDIWKDLKSTLSFEKNINNNFLDHLKISISGLDEVTLTHSRKWNNEKGSLIETWYKEIKTHLEEELSMDVKWIVSDKQ